MQLRPCQKCPLPELIFQSKKILLRLLRLIKAKDLFCCRSCIFCNESIMQAITACAIVVRTTYVLDKILLTFTPTQPGKKSHLALVTQAKSCDQEVMGSSRKVIGIALLNEVLAGVFLTSGFTIVGYQRSQCLFRCFSVFCSLSFFFSPVFCSGRKTPQDWQQSFCGDR